MYAKTHRFRYVSNIFCTSNRWERIGGIPSLARAIFDRTTLFPTFHGPPQIEHCLSKFAELTDLDPELAVSERQFNHKSYHEDSHIQVDSVKLNRTNAQGCDDETVIAFVCRLRPRKGTVLLSKITANNIPIEYIRSINEGKDVIHDGDVIKAEDYLSPGFAGGNFLSMFSNTLLIPFISLFVRCSFST